MDLFNNPMVESAKKAMTSEQMADYKKIGEYMYNDKNFSLLENGSQLKEASQEDIVAYAVEGLKAGLDPMNLSQREVEELCNVYGEKWYERFDYNENEVPKLQLQLQAETAPKLCRQVARKFRRDMMKMARKNSKNNKRQ
jgi:hypothetical protein